MENAKLLFYQALGDFHRNCSFLRRSFFTINPRNEYVKKNKKVSIRKSHLPNSGQGVFANKSFETGEIILQFEGDVIPSYMYIFIEELDHAAKIDLFNMVLPYTKDYGQIINHSFDAEKVNVYFQRDSTAKKVTVIAKRYIKPNEELYTCYDDAHLYMQPWSRAILRGRSL